VRHLFSPEGERALLAVLRTHPMLAFDFDGTLAPIVARADDARVSKAVSRWLEQLAGVAPVAILTGRAVADVAPRLGFEPRYIIGNHGSEDPNGHLPAPSAGALDGLRCRLAHRAGVFREAGVTVEDKRFSLALHYRLAKNQALAIACISEALGELGPDLKQFGGKCVVNISPANAPDKADALVSLIKLHGVSSAVFVGDDLNDESVFGQAQPDWLTVKIGRDYPASQARFFLDSHSEMAILLQKMLSLLSSD
jgi:trehalose 6-phosphate phosphatase